MSQCADKGALKTSQLNKKQMKPKLIGVERLNTHLLAALRASQASMFTLTTWSRALEKLIVT
jgi:hypothetical protein